jgi:lysophospholipase L1-like esterase
MVMIGGNDLDADDRHFDMDCFVHKLVAFLTHLRNRFQLQTVTLFSFFPRDRTRNSTPEEYSRRQQHANRTLRDLCASSGLRFWKLHGFTFSEQPLPRRDGVHLTPGGMYKLLRQIRGIILHTR